MDKDVQPMRILLVLLALLSTTCTDSFLFVAASGGSEDKNPAKTEDAEAEIKEKVEVEHNKISHGAPHTGTKRRPKSFTKDTWAIAATSPLFANKASTNPLQRQPVQQQTPYVHWTCFRQQQHPARPHDILPCCQEIYKVQESHSNLLCWKRDGCQADKAGRSEFISHCSHHAVHLRGGGGLLPAGGASSSSFQPQFTFVSAPEFSDLHWADDGHFRQLIAYSSIKNQEEQWYYDVHSPLELALDPLSLLVDDNDSAADTAPAATFTAKLTSTVLPDEDDDEDERILTQKIHIDLPPQAEPKKSWKVSLNIMLFLPEDIDLIRGREALSSCTTSSSCASATTCTITKGERVISTTSSSWMFDQQSVQYVKLEVDQLVPSSRSVEGDDNSDNDNDSGCELSWIVHVMVPDDDNILLPSPIIFNGTAVHEQDETILFRSEHEYPMPMTMALDDDWGSEL